VVGLPTPCSALVGLDGLLEAMDDLRGDAATAPLSSLAQRDPQRGRHSQEHLG